jgi:NADH-ubiquinone oxidoreductase chain 1
VYYFSPVFSLFISLLIWICIPYFIKIYSFNLGLLFFLSCSRLRVYTIIITGWSSNSNYSLLGGLRAVAQTISYEVSLRLILISFILLIIRFNLFIYFTYQKYIWFIFIRFPLILCWFASSLAETNRTPFDFAEGESELVSGFNVEYRRGRFALIFLSEYIRILFMSILFVILFLGGNLITLYFYLKLRFIAYIFIWVRGVLPRFRYDKLIYLAWKRFLPISLHYLFFFFILKLFLLIKII